jgi:hypothetical protein
LYINWVVELIKLWYKKEVIEEEDSKVSIFCRETVEAMSSSLSGRRKGGRNTKIKKFFLP